MRARPPGRRRGTGRARAGAGGAGCAHGTRPERTATTTRCGGAGSAPRARPGRGSRPGRCTPSARRAVRWPRTGGGGGGGGGDPRGFGVEGVVGAAVRAGEDVVIHAATQGVRWAAWETTTAASTFFRGNGAPWSPSNR